METWRPTVGYDGYFVSNLGHAKRGEIPLRIHVEKKGYNYVNLMSDAKKKGSQLLHRLVAKAFLPNPDNLPQVNHKDGNKKNNHIDNLEWCTNAYNYQHAKVNGLLPIRKKGGDNAKAQLTNDEALEIRSAKISTNGRGGLRRIDLAKKYGVTIHVIKDIRSRRSYDCV